MQNGAEQDYSLLGQRKYIRARINPNPNPIVNPKPYSNPKITPSARVECFYGRDYRKLSDILLSADLVLLPKAALSQMQQSKQLAKSFTSQVAHGAGPYIRFL